MKAEHKALKGAFGDALSSVGTLDKAAKFCRVGKTTLASYYDPHNPGAFAPVDVIADLEALAPDGVPHVTVMLCRLNDGEFVPNPKARAGRENLLASIARLAKENSDIAQVVLTALEDGAVSEAEADAALQQVREGQSVLASLAAQLIAIKGDER